MKNRAFMTIACSSFLFGSVMAAHVQAEDSDLSAKTQNVIHEATDKASDAWREGKLDTVFMFNRHLNNFSIDPEVRGDTVTLIGKVESDVDKELAEQVALSLDDIDSVDNQLTVVPAAEARRDSNASDRAFSDRVEDATLTAEVKVKLLANSETEGLSIDVDTRGRTVTLSGAVESSAEKDLAAQIAENVEGVDRVLNQLEVQAS